MADENFLILTCPYADCHTRFKMRKPLKSGVYKPQCPSCKRPVTVRFTNTPSGEQKPSGPPQDAPVDYSTKPFIKIPGEFEVGKKSDIICPHCHQARIGYIPKEVGVKGFACPKCHGKIAVEAKAPQTLEGDFIIGISYDLPCPSCGIIQEGYTPKETGIQPITCKHCHHTFFIEARQKTQPTFSTSLVKGKLRLLRSWGRKTDYQLKDVGKMIVGRYDKDCLSDISIKNDEYMSRRSIEIEVVPQYDERRVVKGYFYKLRVLKATNPVLLNNAVLAEGDVVSLNFGDSIILGKTKFLFIKAV